MEADEDTVTETPAWSRGLGCRYPEYVNEDFQETVIAMLQVLTLLVGLLALALSMAGISRVVIGRG